MKIDVDSFLKRLEDLWIRSGKPDSLTVSIDLIADVMHEDGKEVLKTNVLRMVS